jgi:spore maturation protein CgeB
VFVEKIQYLADNSSERKRMGEQGHKDVETIYNSRVMAKHFSEAYSSSKKDIKDWHKQDVAAYL